MAAEKIVGFVQVQITGTDKNGNGFIKTVYRDSDEWGTAQEIYRNMPALHAKQRAGGDRDGYKMHMTSIMNLREMEMRIGDYDRDKIKKLKNTIRDINRDTPIEIYVTIY